MRILSFGCLLLWNLIIIATIIYIGRTIAINLKSRENKNIRTENGKKTEQCLQMMTFLIVADLDRDAAVKRGKKTVYESLLMYGVVRVTADEVQIFVVNHEIPLISPLNSSGRGMELSEIRRHNNQLKTFDDKTGIIYDILVMDNRSSSPVNNVSFERLFLSPDPNLSLTVIPSLSYSVYDPKNKYFSGFKFEWASPYNDNLYIGSHGQKVIDKSTGKTILDNSEIISLSRSLNPVNNMNLYSKVKEALQIGDSGYVTHEAVIYSAVHKKWYALPRKISKEPYEESADEYKGSSIMVAVSEDFQNVEIINILTSFASDKRRGFSAASFLPNSNDDVIVALKTVELGKENIQETYITMFKINGEVIVDDTLISNNHKYEGLEFI